MKHRKIRNVMTTDVATVRESALFKDIVRVLDQRDVSAVPVLDADGRVIGVVSNADLLPKQANMHLRSKPTVPSPTIFVHVATPRVPQAWQPYLVT